MWRGAGAADQNSCWVSAWRLLIVRVLTIAVGGWEVIENRQEVRGESQVVKGEW